MQTVTQIPQTSHSTRQRHRIQRTCRATGCNFEHMGCKRLKLNAAKLALQMPQPNPQAMESAQCFMARVAKIDVGRCPCCKEGRLRVTAVLQGKAYLPAPPGAPAGVVAQHSRGPP